ncbi:MAG: hypothetical protein NXH82_15395 [Rhodobacteraceae bacterium]|nr:hypothetical protein [Paracoccaceae bacterium]
MFRRIQTVARQNPANLIEDTAGALAIAVILMVGLYLPFGG